MAAASDARSASVVALRHMTPEDLEPLLREEEGSWLSELNWDFKASAGLVRRFTGMRALNGHGLWIAGRAIGYCYFVCEEHKGLVGDLYVMKEYACREYENQLLSAAISAMMESPFLCRIESQLMMLREPLRDDLPQAAFLKAHRRNFMRMDLAGARRLPPGPSARRIRFENWSESRQDDAAQLIATAYLGHVDSEINDQYRTASGARRFLANIVQYPGCGTFFPPASFLAVNADSGRLEGLCLSSLVSENAGHITQVCVSPESQGAGIGYELVRRSLLALAAQGRRHASLTVTTSNEGAVSLYERIGFAEVKQFAAYVWEGF